MSMRLPIFNNLLTAPSPRYNQSPPLPPITRRPPAETHSTVVPTRNSPTHLSSRPLEENLEGHKPPKISPVPVSFLYGS